MRIWLSDLTYDQQVIAADTIPTNVGYIASYLKDRSEFKQEIELFKYPGDLIESIETKELPDLVGFSNFVWNSNLAYMLASRIKELKPEIIVVFGGIHYPSELHKQKVWMKEHPVIDFYVYKEGEVAFHGLVDSLEKNELSVAVVKEMELPGVHYYKADGDFHAPEPAPRVRDLSSFPSPYTSGLLDKFFDGKLMPILTTNRGCPFTCAFCAEGVRYYTIVNKNELNHVVDELNYIADMVNGVKSDAVRRDIYISDSNFGMFDRDIEICKEFRKLMDTKNWPEYVYPTTGKNRKEKVLECAKILDGRLKLSGSVQSLDKEVQKNIGRKNIRAEELLSVAMDSTDIGSDSYSEIILGLPGDSLRAHEYSLETIINAKFDMVMSWQLVILPETILASDELREKFDMRTKYRVLTKSYGNYEFKRGENVNVAEIEEICVSGVNLPFEDYLKAREIGLVINIFYNNRFFNGVVKTLDQYGIDRFNWVKECQSAIESHSNLKNVFSEFIEETKNELWDSLEELEAFIAKPGVIDQYLDGTYGGNLMAKYRIIALMEHINEVCSVAGMALKKVLEKEGKLDAELSQFVDELLLFEKERKREIFNEGLPEDSVPFSYDIIGFLEDKETKPARDYVFADRKKVKFYRSEDTNALIKRNNAIFGTSIAGKYKQLTRTPIKKYFRDASYSEDSAVLEAQIN